MDPFDHISATLLNHLPRVVVDGPVSLDSSGLRVDSRGVSIGDLSELLTELTDHEDFIPESLPVRDVVLKDLSLIRSPVTPSGLDLRFTVAWHATDLTVADTFPLRMAEASFRWHGGEMTATAKVVLQIDDMELDAELELPSQVVSAKLAPADADKAAPFLAKRGLVAGSGAHKLQVLSVAASLPFRHVVGHVELADLFTIGPLTLKSAMAEVVLAGGAGGSALSAEAVVEIAVNARNKLNIGLAGAVDPGGWRMAGELALDGQAFSIGTLAKTVASKLNQAAPKLPGAIAELKLSHIGVALDTHDQSIVLDCALDWTGHDADMVVHIEKRRDTLAFSGTLTLGEVVLKVAFDKGGSAVLVGSYDAAGTQKITLDKMLQALGIDAAATFGPGGTGIDIGVDSLGVALDGKARMLLAAEVNAGVDLSRLGDVPVVGALLPKGVQLGLRVAPYYMSPGFSAAGKARDLLPSSLGLPARLQDNMHLSAELHLGGPPISLPSVDLGSSPKQAAAPKPTAKPAPQPPARAESLKWVEVGKSLGPLHIRRIGWSLSADSDKEIDLAFDGGISVAGLTLSLNGLGARYRFSDQHLEAHLQGLELDLRKGPLAISGGFLNVDGDFAGKIMIGTPKFSISALGAFKMLDGSPSVFIFGVLGMPLGGPVFFFVEGLAAGFGVHRHIHMPKIEDVRSFPLIAAARDTAVGNPPDDEPDAQLRALHEYVQPELGRYFFAAGIKFNSFRLLHGNLVAIVSFGRDFEVDLVGTADFSTPPDLPASVPALAKIQLDLTARIAPSEGLIAVEARLNPKSYVYGPLCHLSGGFAFYSWMKGEHAGDFVLSVGGYNRHYKVPKHYPPVPRVELKYAITDDVSLKGNAYFAMTPSVMMAGGGLHANAQIGSAHAWADFTVDFLVRWEPFHYDAWMHIGIGARYKCFHTTASADLHIWGPKFSGVASIDWAVFSFDVEFGPRTANLPLPISFKKFETSFLGYNGSQKSRDATLGIILSDGVIGQAGETPIVAPVALEFETSSRVPINTAFLGSTDLKVAKNARLGIAPVIGHSIGVSKHTITISRGGVDVTKDFKIRKPVAKTKFPSALWGKSFSADPKAKPIDAVSGLTLLPVKPVKAGRSRLMKVSDEIYEVYPQTITAPAAAPGGDLVILSLRQTGSMKVPVIRLIRELTGLGLREAKAIADAGKGEILRHIPRARARAIAQQFEEIGAKASIRKAPSHHLTRQSFGSFDLVLMAIGPRKIQVIKLVRKITGLGLREAKKLLESERPTIIAGVATADVERLTAAFSEIEASLIPLPAADRQGRPHPPKPPPTAHPADLPIADLEALGLKTDGLSPAPQAALSGVIDLGAPREAGHG
ncbi:MAG: ribosomal protein L7/L12 [Pseudomonadota bacterium]